MSHDKSIDKRCIINYFNNPPTFIENIHITINIICYTCSLLEDSKYQPHKESKNDKGIQLLSITQMFYKQQHCPL